MPVNVKEFEKFFGAQLASFRQNFVNNSEFHWFIQNLYFVISFVFVRDDCVDTCG